MSSPETPVFVMPFYGDEPRHRLFLDRAVAGLRAQSDSGWQLVIVDDASPSDAARDHLRQLAADSDGQITAVFRSGNSGQGVCRNVGVAWAAEHAAPFVLFHDADDISHPDRLRTTRQVFATRPDIDFVYSTFQVIDADDDPVPLHLVTPSVTEILDIHQANPVTGPDAWIRIATETGYTTQTSTVAVRTALALAHPFPAVRGSEDSHTWLRMSAGGTGFWYAASIPTRYRVTRDPAGSSDRARLGAGAYYRQMVDMNRAGFEEATVLAATEGRFPRTAVPELRRRFLHRLAESMAKEGQHDLADALTTEAARQGMPFVPTGAA